MAEALFDNLKLWRASDSPLSGLSCASITVCPACTSLQQFHKVSPFCRIEESVTWATSTALLVRW